MLQTEVIDGVKWKKRVIDPKPQLVEASTKYWFMAGFAATLVYLVHGSFASTVCNVLTALPPAFFTVQMMVQSTTPLNGYRAIMIYWIVYGLLSFVDTFLGTSHGYYLLKFVFLALGFGVVTKMNGPVVNNLLGKAEYERINIDTNDMLTTSYAASEEMIPIEVSEFLLPTDQTQSVMTRSVMTNVKSSLSMESIDSSPDLVLNLDRLEDAQAMNPKGDREIVFTPSVQRNIITLVNRSKENIMFALKSNATERLHVVPSYGFLERGKSCAIGVELRKEASCPTSYDKLAVDYSLVGEDRQYDHSFLQRPDKIRCLFRVAYN